MCGRLGRDLEQTFKFDAGIAYTCGIRPAGLRRHVDLWLAPPVGTPHAIVDRLSEELRAVLASNEVRARIIAEGGKPEPTTPEQHADVIDREV